MQHDLICRFTVQRLTLNVEYHCSVHIFSKNKKLLNRNWTVLCKAMRPVFITTIISCFADHSIVTKPSDLSPLGTKFIS